MRSQPWTAATSSLSLHARAAAEQVTAARAEAERARCERDDAADDARRAGAEAIHDGFSASSPNTPVAAAEPAQDATTLFYCCKVSWHLDPAHLKAPAGRRTVDDSATRMSIRIWLQRPLLREQAVTYRVLGVPVQCRTPGVDTETSAIEALISPEHGFFAAQLAPLCWTNYPFTGSRTNRAEGRAGRGLFDADGEY